MPKQKQKKEPRYYNNILIESDEEMYAIMWMQELKDKGIIRSFERAETFELSKPLKHEYVKLTTLKTKLKTEVKSQTILHECSYTPDFVIVWNENDSKFVDNMTDMIGEMYNNVLISNQLMGMHVTYVEVKPTYDQNGKEQYFKLNQKWLWADKGIFVNLFKPTIVFEKTFTPKAYLLTATGKIKKVHHKIVSLEQYLGYE